MPFVPAPNIIQAEIRSRLDNQQIENRIFVNVFHEPTVADMTAIAVQLASTVQVLWVPLMPLTWVCTEFFLRSMHAPNAPQASFPQAAGSNTGTAVSPQMPNNVTLCVSLRSNFAGRSARGRLYWQALNEAQVTGNLVNQGSADAIVQAVRDIDVRMTSIGFAWSIVSFFNNNAPRPGGPVYFEVNDVMIVDLVVDSQRRRLPGRGT